MKVGQFSGDARGAEREFCAVRSAPGGVEGGGEYEGDAHGE